jgi:hypothetical protein
MSKDLVTLICPPTEFEANILAIVLRDHGIEAFVFATPTIGVGVGLSSGWRGVPLQVKKEDMKIARQVLLDNKRHSIDIDWDELQISDEDNLECDSMPMPITARIAFFFVVLALLSFGLLVILNLQ